MSDREKEARIKNRIRESNKRYTPRQQKVELLLRNHQFLREREQTGYDFSEISSTLEKFSKHKAFHSKWIKFCNRWGIEKWWDGKNKTLSNHISVEPEIFYRDPSEMRTQVLRRNYQYPENCDPHSLEKAFEIVEGGPYVFVKIKPWTDLEDLRRLWPAIVRTKKQVYGYSEVDASTFSRSLCWYDLDSQYNLNRGQIASLWMQLRSNDIDLLVIKRVRRTEINTLSDEKAEGLLKEIKEDPAMKDLKIEFETERENYIHGPKSPFRLTIRESIKRIKEHIKRLTPF
jgi:hypothetical protein